MLDVTNRYIKQQSREKKFVFAPPYLPTCLLFEEDDVRVMERIFVCLLEAIPRLENRQCHFGIGQMCTGNERPALHASAHFRLKVEQPPLIPS